MDFLTQMTTTIETQDKTLKRSDVYSKEGMDLSFVISCFSKAMVDLIGSNKSVGIKKIIFEIKTL